MTLILRPLPRRLARALSLVSLAAWVAVMVLLFRGAWASSPVSLAADLAGYTPSARWSGVYYRGDKIGFSVSQTVATPTGYEIREDGRLQMSLLGSQAAVRLKNRARVDRAFSLQGFAFSLDPGTGPTEVEGALVGKRLTLTIRTPAGARTETRDLEEVPILALNLSRTLAARGLVPGRSMTAAVFDPATLRNAQMTLVVRSRELVRAAGQLVPAFLVESRVAGVQTRSWITDVGDVVREESAIGLLVQRETPQQAQSSVVPRGVQSDLLQSSALVPSTPTRIDDPAMVARLRIRLTGIEDFDRSDLDGEGQTASSDVLQIVDPESLRAGPRPPGLDRWLHPEPLLESDAPEIRREAERAVAGIGEARRRADRLTRYVHGLIEKKPTVSLPSALEVLRTKVGDCNEHTSLYVAMARALGLPARIEVGLVYLHGAFYYHAWPSVFVDEGPGRGLWLPVDPTLNQFPADATHVRLARGGLDRQASILGLLGRARLEVLSVTLRPGSVPVLVGRPPTDLRPLDLPLPHRDGGGCWSSPPRPGQRG